MSQFCGDRDMPTFQGGATRGSLITLRSHVKARLTHPTGPAGHSGEGSRDDRDSQLPQPELLSLEAAGTPQAWLDPRPTCGYHVTAVLPVELRPGLGLTVLAAGQDPVAAGAGRQADTDGAATLVAKLEEGQSATDAHRQVEPAPLPRSCCLHPVPDADRWDIHSPPFPPDRGSPTYGQEHQDVQHSVF